MKKNKLIIMILIIIAVLLIAIVSLAQANIAEKNNNGEYEDNYSPTADRTFVRLKRTANDKIDVYLELADTTIADGTEEVIPGASVSSFQIGLDIEMDLEDRDSAISFEFDPSLNEEAYCKLMKTTWADKEKEEGHAIVEQLNIYYSGTKELNDAGKLEGIKVGTITFKGIKEQETITIVPNANFTTIASIGHSETKVDIKPEDSLSQIIIEPTTGGESPAPTPTGEAPTPTQQPTPGPTEEPTPTPTKVPTVTPTPTEAPTEMPTVKPTPSVTPTEMPTITPTPTEAPTETPTVTPTPDTTPTETPTVPPTVNPTDGETQNPEETPTESPEVTPTNASKPTQKPSSNNSGIPTTGDIAIELFIVLMVVSLIGIIAILRLRKVKSVKNRGNHKK